LKKLLEGVGEEELRRPGLEIIGRLEAARREVVAATGDAGKLDEALSKLEETFTGLTGVAATRSAGKTYAGRTLIYEDCRRDADIEIGPEFFERLGPPLSLLLTSARWFTYEAAKIYRKVCHDIYYTLSRQRGTRVVDALSVWRASQDVLYGRGQKPVEALMPVFQRKWAGVLCVEAGARRADYSSAELRPRVEREFAAPGPGWRAACYHSPDVMVEADGAEAARRGDYRIVLGELHIGGNTFKPSCFFAQHPRPEELVAALDHDIPEPRLVPITPKNWPNMNSRTQPMLLSKKDYRLAVSPDAYTLQGAPVLPIGELVVEEEGGQIFLRSHDGSFRSEILEACAEAFTGHVIQRFNILEPAAHTPRVTIDGVVVCRESWRLDASTELPFASERDEAARFLAARRLAQKLGLPRRVFAKVPVEVKPFYVDFESPVYVEMLARAVRRTAEAGGRVTLTEMLPGAGGAWLEDAEGRRYTSELRIVAVDPLA